jgi:hypothetical protein
MDDIKSPEDIQLDFSQETRMNVAKKLLTKGVPENSDDIRLLLTVLDGVDRTAIGRKRIATDEKVADSAIMEREIIARLLSRDDDFLPMKPAKQQAQPANVLVEYTPKPGEAEVGIVTLSYNDFVTSDIPDAPVSQL